jgi:glycosyltransferase involved in cell wall biosynthesis
VVVHTPHGHVFGGYFSAPATKAFALLERYAARHTDRLIALTTRGINDHLREGIGRPEQWLSIFSGIDVAPYEQAIARREETRQSLGYTRADVLVGYVGRLEPVKGLPYFVDAARAVAYESPEARFLVVGHGAQRDDLEALARPLGSRVRFMGLRHDVHRIMAALDVFVLPSVNEGQGRVLLEAGAAAVPAVATSVGGVPDVVVHGHTGLLVPPRDPDALADAIVTLARDPDRRRAMGQAARAVVVPSYSLDAMVRQVEALYERLLEEKRR